MVSFEEETGIKVNSIKTPLGEEDKNCVTGIILLRNKSLIII